MILKKYLPLFITNYFVKGNERSLKAKKNIIASVFIKGLSVLLSFILVPATLAYLDHTRYGLWLTISSFLMWVSLFDIGVGNGLRNKLAEALAVKDYNLAKIYLSTAYAIMFLLVVFLLVIFLSINFFLRWNVILNVNNVSNLELQKLAFIIFGFFFVEFLLKIITFVLHAFQSSAQVGLLALFGNVIAFINVIVVSFLSHNNLLLLGFSYSISNIFVLIIATIYLYSKKLKVIRPSLKLIQLKHSKSILNTGFKFFLIQISMIIIFQTSSVIIANNFGPEEVIPYNLAFRFFSMISVIFSFITMPLWSACTEAWVKGEIDWIKKTVNKLVKIWGILCLFGIIMILFSKQFFYLWVGKDIEVPYIISILMFIQIALFTFGSVYNIFINGVGKIYLQLVSMIISSIMFFPITFFCIDVLHLGVISVLISSIVVNFYSPIIAPIQYYRLVYQKATGIWNK